MKASEITALIDTASRAVDKSKMGPVVMQRDTNGVPISFSNGGFPVFLNILGCLMGQKFPYTSIHQNYMHNPKERWEEGDDDLPS